MKEKDRLKILFDQARSEKPITKIDSVEKLVRSGKRISSGKIKLGKPGRGLFNPLNLIIMISTIAIITSLFVIFNSNPDVKIIEEDFGVHIYEYPEVIENSEQIIVQNENRKAEKVVKDKDSEVVIIIPPGIRKPSPDITKTKKNKVLRGQILHLKKDQLERIGFNFDENGYYYLNELSDESKINLWSFSEKGKRSSSGFGRGDYINQAIRVRPSTNDYYPVCISSLNGDDIRAMNGLPDDFVNKFEYYNDTLVPVILSWSELGGRKGNNRLAWFKVSDKFFKDLGSEFDDMQSTYSEVKDLGQMVVYDYSFSQLNIGEAIKLDNSLLKSMGFSVTTDSLVFHYGSSVEFWITSFSSGLKFIGRADEMKKAKELNQALLIAVTNVLTSGSMNINPKVLFSIDSTINGDNWIDVCIPIVFTSGSGQLWEGNTFWFYPDENLFSKLPDSIGYQMRLEYNANVAPVLRGTDLHVAPMITGVMAPDSIYARKTEVEPVPCQYFPSFCEGLPGLDEINVYPNPATDLINVELTISRAKTVDFRVFDISGRLMIDEVETQKYEDAGMYRQQIDLSSLEEGFYLLVLTDDEGAKMTRRVIKQ